MSYSERVSYLLFVLVLFALSILTFAGGPRTVGFDGHIIRWDPQEPVRFVIDQGTLGTLSNQQGADLVRWAASRWNDIGTSQIELEDAGFMNVDVEISNYEDILMSPQSDSPVVFDTSGTITSDLLGAGSSNTVLGFTFAFATDDASEYSSGWVVMNGQRAQSSKSSTFAKSIIHELGHLLGLDHSQGLIENFGSGGFGGFGRHVPLMFPIGFFTGPDGPIQDEISWISWLYPTPEYPQQTGTIKGQVFRRSGAGFQGANVVAVPAVLNGDGTFSPGRTDVVSVVSDFLMAGTGEFELPGLEPGNYFVFIDSLDSRFTGGSGVGPFDQRATNFPRDYFNLDESAEDDPNDKVVIQVEAGQTVGDVDIVANELINRLDLLGDDDEMLFSFAEVSPGFSFPFFGKVYHEVVVNSDGNLTFEVGDGKVSEPRTEARFLTGPPRIAPLFSDMDPDAGGAITHRKGDGWIEFKWDEVPEFSGSGSAGPNSFSVRLFSNGDILFDYDEVVVTADEGEGDPSSWLHSVVGIAPGQSTQRTGSRNDLSSVDAGFQIEQQPIYEVFTGSDFDLTNQKIYFQASTSEFYFPMLSGDAGTFTGFAFSNLSGMEASVTAESRGNDGSLSTFPTNPASFTVEAGKQSAQLAREIFNVAPSAQRSGWMRIQSNRPDLGSFFMFGNGLQGPVTRMDGSTVQTTQSDRLFFTVLYDGPAVFPSRLGAQDAVTTLYLVNPNEEPIDLTLKLYWNTGAQRGLDVNTTIPPRGRLERTVRELFNLPEEDQVASGFVEVIVTSGEGAIGFESVQLTDTLLGLNAALPNEETVSYSAQLAVGLDIFTRLQLINASDSSLFVTIRAHLVRDGALDLREQRITLEPRQSLQDRNFQNSVDSIFGLPQAANPPLVGSIVVEATGPGLIGNVVFGDPNRARYAAVLPLQNRLFTRAIHSQVSNGVDANEFEGSSFTGLAVFNPNDQQANVTIEVYNREGDLVGSAVEQLAAKARLSETVAELVPESVGLVRGYITLESTRPIVAQQLFGNNGLDYLSAVIPTIIE